MFAAFSAASNVTGVIQPLHKLAKIAHAEGAFIFFDFAASGPYVKINMHKNDAAGDYFDGIYLSPHKFPGGQGSPGVLVFRSDLACNKVTYTPSGGTVRFLCKKFGPIYSNDIEVRETGGTPNIIGIIKTALAFQIKNAFINEIEKDETKLTDTFTRLLKSIQKECHNLIILNPFENKTRLPIFSFQIKGFHYNFIVALLCDMFGITCRGGVSCSGVLAETLLNISDTKIQKIQESILNGNGVNAEYGWVRITLSSLHSRKDIFHIANCIRYLCTNAHNFLNMYTYSPKKNIYMQG